MPDDTLLWDPIAREAYLHGRTLGRLEDARESLEEIASKKTRNLKDAKDIAKRALRSTAERPGEPT